MASATIASQTIRADEAAHFGKLAADWWNPRGSSAMLHKLNPVRLGFLRDAIDAHWGLDPLGIRPLAGKSVLDVGCGAGLLCEPLARLGGAVSGVDAAAQNVAVAAGHARGSGLEIAYHHGELADLALGQFDMVCALEVIEHVADPGDFIAQLAAHLAPGGLMVLSCPNRTPKSRLLLVEAAEGLGMVPRGTHDWDRFITPPELAALLEPCGLVMDPPRGIAWSPAKGLHLSDDMALNYIATVHA